MEPEREAVCVVEQRRRPARQVTWAATSGRLAVKSMGSELRLIVICCLNKVSR